MVVTFKNKGKTETGKELTHIETSKYQEAHFICFTRRKK